MTILDLIPNLKRMATTNGGEYAGPCFFCGGKDRFRVWPEEGLTGRFWCRGCGRSGDAIQLLRDRDRLTYQEACLRLGVMPSLSWKPGPRSDRATTGTTWTPREATTPGDVWQNKARTFLDRAIDLLWSPRGNGTRAWLHNEKGLNDDSIKAAVLGYNYAEIYEPRQSWGLEPVLKEDGTERRQWIPKGLVIPLINGGSVHRLRIRRDEPGVGARYVVVSGSSMAPMTWGQDKGAVVIVESDLDGMLLNQEAGDLAAVAAMGNAQAKPDQITHEGLKKAEIVLVSLDTDEAGAKASWQFWLVTYGGKVKRWPCVGGKDPSAARLGGLDLMAWVIGGIFQTEKRYERFCIQTIDGGLSDSEAISLSLQCRHSA